MDEGGLKINKLMIIGIISTMLIHTTWIWGLDSVVFDILANNIGRCGLFLFVIEIGRSIRENTNWNGLLRKLILIYIVCFTIYNASMIISGNMTLDAGQIVKRLVLGIDGNIWIIHGSILFLMLSIVLRDYKKRFENPSLNWVMKMMGGYCVIAICAFVYANVYQKIYLIDHGLIMKVFTRLLGTNRPSIILAIPFLYFGYVSSVITINRRWLVLSISLVLNIIWIVEIVLLRKFYYMNNVFMTLFGASGTALLYLYIKSTTQSNNVKFDILSVIFFGLQYSITTFVIWLFNIDTIGEYMTLFASYSILTLLLFFALQRRKLP